MNSKDCGVTTAEEYMYITALIATVLLFQIHCHMAHTVLEISLIVKPSKDHLQPG